MTLPQSSARNKSIIKLKALTLLYCGFILSSCAHTVDVFFSETDTSLGNINTSNIHLGYFFLWDREHHTITPVNIIDIDESNIKRYNYPEAKVSLGSSSELTLKSDIELTPSEKATLSSEISSRTSLNVDAPETETVKATITAISNALNQNPDLKKEWELKEAINSEGNKLYVLVYEITKTKKTTVNIDKTKATGNEYESQLLKSKGKINFRILDAEKIEISNFPTFARYRIFKPIYNTEGNYDFKIVTESHKKELIRDITKRYQ